MEVTILAAGKGSRFNYKGITNKCLIKVNGKTLVEKIIEKSIRNNIKKINIIVGYNKKKIYEKLKKRKINFIENNFYSSRDMLYSLKLALKSQRKNMIVVYSDIIFSNKIFKKIKLSKNLKNINLPVLKNWENIWLKRKKNIFEDCETLVHDKKLNLLEIGKKTKNKKKIMAQYMGIVYIPILRRDFLLEEISKIKNKKMHITSFLDLICKKEIIKIQPILDKTWFEFDDKNDLDYYA